MATLQARTVRGHRYWYIVESRRVNGKPRPIVLAYLGKADDLLRRLQQPSTAPFSLKSYTHGAVAALLALVAELDLVRLLNRLLCRSHAGPPQLRDGLTIGASLVLRALERLCAPCSNRAFAAWARTTSLEYLLRISCAPLDSQHFWDQMHAVPEDLLPTLEEALVQRTLQVEPSSLDTLLLDATNFFTFIDSTNPHSTLAQRGKNKQGRNNLRQVGVLLVVTRHGVLPLFHETYAGNKPDSKVFAAAVGRLLERLRHLVGDLEQVTMVFDRGNNSKDNLSEATLPLHYVGALVPSQHPDLVAAACAAWDTLPEETPRLYRERRTLWGRERTVVVYRSAELYEGQLRGVLQELDKREGQLQQLQQRLANPRSKKRTRPQLGAEIEELLRGQFLEGLVTWEVVRQGRSYHIHYARDAAALERLKRTLGLRLVMTDRHDWSTEEIVGAYHSQAWVEQGFRELKNPYHLALRPQYHWTDQKIRVHVFTCVLGLLLVSILYRRARRAGYGPSTYDTFLDDLNRIRLGSILHQAGPGQAVQMHYQLEELDATQELLVEALGIRHSHRLRPEIPGVGVYE